MPFSLPFVKLRMHGSEVLRFYLYFVFSLAERKYEIQMKGKYLAAEHPELVEGQAKRHLRGHCVSRVT